MVKHMEEVTRMPWQVWVALLLFSGGGTMGANILTRPSQEEVSNLATRQDLEVVTEEIRELRLEVRNQNYESWTYRMERDVWDDANRQLRKIDPTWAGPDVGAAKRNNTASDVKKVYQ